MIQASGQDNKQMTVNGVSINEQFYGNLYKHYWKRHFVFDQKYKAQLFYQYIQRLQISLDGWRILDIGFGYGNILWGLPKNCEIMGIELIPEAVNNANTLARKKGYRAFAFYQDSGNSEFPLGNETIDLVVASHVIEHVPDDDRFFMEINRILKSRRYGIFLAPLNEMVKDPNHFRKTDISYFQLKAKQFGFELISSWMSDYLMPYTTVYWVRRYHEKLGFVGKVGSVTWNLFLSSIPKAIYRSCDKLLEEKGKTPHQLLICIRKLGEV